METIIKISQTPSELAGDFASEIAALINNAARKGIHASVALSGGSTPRLLYSILGDRYREKVRWEYVHIFWGDERCVPADDPESNYGMTKTALLDKINIPLANIHRIHGETAPANEAERYSEEIVRNTRTLNNLPRFDLVILGLGDDGHTASIFPGSEHLLESEKICDVAVHPVSGQKRITVTGPVINNAESVVFLVTGSAKSEIVADIIEKPGIVDYPAASIEPKHGKLKWYLDLDAASMLSQLA